MTTANTLFEALSASLDKTPAAVEAYGLALRRFNWWPPTKRGRGASPMTEMHAAKLLLALLSEGPNALPDFFLRYANTRPVQSVNTGPVLNAVRNELGLVEDAGFLDFIAEIVRLYRDGETDLLIYHRADPPGFRDDYLYRGPQIDLRVKGPFPIGVIKFQPSAHLIGKLSDVQDAATEPVTLVFLDQLYGWREDAIKEDEESTQGLDNAIDHLREETSRGIGFERFIGGREFDAVGRALLGLVEDTPGANASNRDNS